MQCTSPIRITKNLCPSEFPDGLLVPCGKCLSCRLGKRREWTARMIHELDSHHAACFITLTYNEENVPEYSSLKKEDLQKFFKRLRKRLSVDKRKIRYFACGEYGDHTQRPHYHAIIFGMSVDVLEQQIIRDCWKFGHVHVGLAEMDSIRYVAQYIDKKYSGDLAEQEYYKKNRESVFRILSLGIGKEYIDKNADQLRKNGFMSIKGVKMSLPRYYVERLGLDLSELQEKVKEMEMDLVAEYTGLSGLTRDDAYHVLPVPDVISMEEGIKKQNKQSNKNLNAKLNLKRKKL